MGGFFTVPDKQDPTKVRKLWTLYMVKHKKQQPNLQEVENNMQQNNKPVMQQEQQNPVLPKQIE
jgi:hypothetical protein